MSSIFDAMETSTFLLHLNTQSWSHVPPIIVTRLESERLAKGYEPKDAKSNRMN